MPSVKLYSIKNNDQPRATVAFFVWLAKFKSKIDLVDPVIGRTLYTTTQAK